MKAPAVLCATAAATNVKTFRVLAACFAHLALGGLWFTPLFGKQWDNAVGLGYGAAITSVNAITPNMPHPGLYAAVVGSYHCIGLLLASAVLYWLS